MDDMWKIMWEIEDSMDKFHRRMLSDFNSQKNRNVKCSTFKFYAKREIDSNGKDLQEAYMEIDGEGKYWKKDGVKETLIEPNQKGKKYFKSMMRNLLPGKREQQ